MFELALRTGTERPEQTVKTQEHSAASNLSCALFATHAAIFRHNNRLRTCSKFRSSIVKS